jgi:hypothetical protein
MSYVMMVTRLVLGMSPRVYRVRVDLLHLAELPFSCHSFRLRVKSHTLTVCFTS